jgi:hypothetical protein
MTAVTAKPAGRAAPKNTIKIYEGGKVREVEVAR